MNTPAQGQAEQINQLIKLLAAQANGSLDIQQARNAWEHAFASHSVEVIAEALALGMLNFQLRPGQHGVARYVTR